MSERSNGIITTVAGSGIPPGFSGDNGPATNAQLYQPSGVAIDSSGNLYIADSGNNRVRKVSNGMITTVAGSGIRGFSGDNGPATNAQLYQPSGVAIDSSGDLYIADHNRIRKVSNGAITTEAGNGTAGSAGDGGPATNAQLNWPIAIAVDSVGNLYVADSDNSRIRKISDGVITTVAGGGVAFPVNNGPATSARLFPTGVAVDSAGNIYISDVFTCARRVSNGVFRPLLEPEASFSAVTMVPPSVPN